MESGQRNKMYSFKEKSLMVGHYFAKTMMLKDLATSFDMSRTTISKWLRIIDYDIKNIDRLKPVEKVKKGKVAADIQSLPRDIRREIDKLLKHNPNWGSLKIKEYFFRHYQKVLSGKSIYYYLKESGVIEARKKASKEASSIAHDRRFEYDAPMKAVQCDCLQLTLAGGEKVQLVTFIDDFSRYILSSRLIPVKTMDGVIKCFADTVRDFGPMERLITDKGSEFVSWKKFTSFEETLLFWDVELIASGPNTPQNQGKIERWHKTFREDFEAVYGPFTTLIEAQSSLLRFISFYNFERPNQAIGGLVPADRFYEMDDELHKALQHCRKSDERIYFSCNLNGQKLIICGPQHSKTTIFLNGAVLNNEQAETNP